MKRRTREQHQKLVLSPEDNPPIVGPVYNSVKYSFASLAEVERLFRQEREGFFYSRVSNPTVRQLEVLLAELQGRDDAVCFASGLAALSVTLLGLLAGGDHVMLFRESYKPTRYLVRSFLKRYGVEHTMLGLEDIDRIEEFVIPGKTKLVIFESPTNPTTRVLNIEKLQELRKHGVLLVMDNTFSGFHNHGQFEVDIFIHSLTKFAGGHSDVMGGAVIGSAKSLEPVKSEALRLGACLDPHAAFLVLRGMKTYTLRYERQCMVAMELATRLQGHPAVARVWYPGLTTHPDWELARAQLHDSGCIISLDLKGAEDNLRIFLDGLQLFALVGSLGCTESLVAPSRLFYGGDLSESEKDKADLLPTTVRLSVGVEDVEDLWDDLLQALTGLK